MEMPYTYTDNNAQKVTIGGMIDQLIYVIIRSIKFVIKLIVTFGLLRVIIIAVDLYFKIDVENIINKIITKYVKQFIQ